MDITNITVKGFANVGLDTEVTIDTEKGVFMVETAMKVSADPLYYAFDTANHTLLYIEHSRPI